MKNLPIGSLLSLAAFGLIIGASSAGAQVVPNYNGYTQSPDTYFDGDISTSSLIYSGNASLDTDSLSGNASTSGTIAGTDDGTADDSNLAGTELYLYVGTSGSFSETLSYTLNTDPLTGGSATGYDITSLNSIVGYDSGNHAGQDFTLYLSTLTTPAFTQYGGTFVNNFTYAANLATETSLTNMGGGPIATGVTGIELVYVNPPTYVAGNGATGGGGDSVLREIDVFGTPSASVSTPEPSTYALLLAGVGLLVARSRLRSRAA
jgi:hypothetical protein